MHTHTDRSPLNRRRGQATTPEAHRVHCRLHAKVRARERYGIKLHYNDVLRHENLIEAVDDKVTMIRYDDNCIFFELTENGVTYYPVYKKELECITTYYLCREWCEKN